MLLQLLLVLLTVRSPAVPALGVAIPFFSNSDDEAARDLPGDGKDNEEFSVTVKSEYHGNVPLILRQTENARTFESLARNAEQALDNKVMKDAEGNSHFQIPLILLPTEEIKVMHEGEKPVIRKDLHNNNARQDDDNHGDRGESARIVNVQGQRRNPVYPGAGSRKSIKLNKPPAIRIQDSYEPFQYSNFPSYQQQHQSQWSDPYISPYSSPGVDRLLLGMVKAFLNYLSSKPKLRNGPVLPIPSEKEEFHEISIDATITSDDTCAGGWWQWFSWFFCKIGL